MIVRCAAEGCSSLVFGSGYCVECEKEDAVREPRLRQAQELRAAVRFKVGTPQRKRVIAYAGNAEC